MRYRAWYLVIAACALFAVLVLPLRGALVDDSYIHLVYARNLAERGELSFNAGEPSYGATSPLWIAMLAAVHLAGGNLVVSCHLLSVLFALGSIILAFRIVLRISGDGDLSAAAALILSAEAWVVRWSAVGMETSFALFMVMLSLDASLSATDSLRRSALFGLVLFCAVLARPEAVLLVPIAFAAFLLTRRLRARGGLAWLVVFASLYIAWLVVIERHTGTYLPMTAGAKQGRPDFSLAMLRRSLVPLRIMGATLAVPWLVIVSALGRGLLDRPLLSSFTGSDEHESTLLVLLFWAIAVPAVYTVLDFQVLSRYLVPVAPAVVILACVGFDGLTGRVRARRAALAAFTAVVLLQNVYFYSAVVVRPTREFSRGLEEVLGGMGRWLERNAEREALVAAPDIGAIGYYSGRRILDLGGLISREINEMRRNTPVETIIDEGLYLRFEPDYLVDRSERPDRFAEAVIAGYRFIPVVRGRVDNLGIRKPEPVFYVLYRLEKVEG
jgi:hypothetical protein